ncbi:hypothetical protein [Micromonospora sediminicola]|uniref:hypothetical protein n=1 Tax=Micromonospora sediminicola TaxID=946078 RepID=UPI0037A84C94
MSVLVWEEPPPASEGTGLVPHELIAATLRSRPGKWARLVEGGSAVGLVTWINKGGRLPYQPSGSFEAVYRKGAIYARYVGRAAG